MHNKLMFGGILFIIVILIGSTVAVYLNENTYNITVTDKETKKDGDTSRYIVFSETSNGEVKVFENTDAIFVGKFNSSDMQGRLKVGETYEVKTIGFRIPILSMYENIVEVN